jgi:hypothetical protein
MFVICAFFLQIGTNEWPNLQIFVHTKRRLAQRQNQHVPETIIK